ncbi:MAG: hypothetical protein NWF01_04165 [Candidatus Bathyarchaeota archaeon]|nr:hypothetical protein [Candidatus Bathyarchaeota archaeon]
MPDPKSTKANAMLCPFCCVEYLEIEVDLEIDGEILRDVKALRCPNCQDEQFSPEHLEEISKKLKEKD